VSLRFVGDTRLTIGAAAPQYLSESSFILAFGVSTEPWRGIVAWAEAGTALSYVKRHALPDYRAGFSIARSVGRSLRAESPGWFTDATLDGVFVSRFGNDFLLYEQTRLGYTFGPAQLYWNANVTVDARSQAWANFVESGPGIRIGLMPRSAFLTLNYFRGAYLADRPSFTDFRAGLWYAFSR